MFDSHGDILLFACRVCGCLLETDDEHWPLECEPCEGRTIAAEACWHSQLVAADPFDAPEVEDV